MILISLVVKNNFVNYICAIINLNYKTMKKSLILSLVAVAAIFVSSCKKEAVKVETDINSSLSVYFNIPVDSVPGYKEYNKQIVNSDLETKLNEYKASLDDVKSVVVESMEWSLVDGSTMTFDAIDYVDSYFMNEGGSESKIAYLNPVAHDGSKTIKLSSSGTDLKEFLSKKSFYVISKGFNNAKVLTEQPIKITINYKIRANVVPLK